MTDTLARRDRGFSSYNYTGRRGVDRSRPDLWMAGVDMVAKQADSWANVFPWAATSLQGLSGLGTWQSAFWGPMAAALSLSIDCRHGVIGS